MFTIKHIHMDGSEDLQTASSIRFTEGKPAFVSNDGGCSGTPSTLWADGKPLTGGTIFVMNESGKTVARYDLGASPVPITGDGLSDPRPLGTGRLNSGLAGARLGG